MVSGFLGNVAVQATTRSLERKPDWAKALALQEQIPTSVPIQNNALFLVSQSTTFLAVNDTPNNVCCEPEFMHLTVQLK